MKENRKSRTWRLVLFAAALLVCSSAMRAQEPDTPEQPKPAGRGIPGVNDNSTEDANQQDNSNNWTPDTMPLTGLAGTDGWKSGIKAQLLGTRLTVRDHD